MACAYLVSEIFNLYFSTPISPNVNIQLNPGNHQQTMIDIMSVLNRVRARMKVILTNNQVTRYGILALSGFTEICIHKFSPSLSISSRIPLRMVQSVAMMKFAEYFSN
jgi:hypothetical protein